MATQTQNAQMETSSGKAVSGLTDSPCMTAKFEIAVVNITDPELILNCS